MEDFVKRLIEEHQDDKDRWIKLADFIKYNEAFTALPEEQQALMMRQEVIMKEKVEILEERLRYFGIECNSIRDFKFD